jgi:type I restriction enzyme M protein
MWRRLSAQNYRSYADVSVDLAPFTVVVGPNSSGKSTFADLFVFAAEVASGNAENAVRRRGGIVGLRRWSPSKPFDVSISVAVSGSRPALAHPEVSNTFTLHSGRGGAWSFSRFDFVAKGVPKQVPPGFPVGGAEGAPLRRVRRIRPNPDAMRPPWIATDRSDLSESADNITDAFRSLSEVRRETVVQTMARIAPGLRDIQVEAFDRYLMLRFTQEQARGKVATFGATEMSDGALRALGILTALAQLRRDRLLVVEEPEVSVHPGAARLLYDALQQASRHGSVLVTTHSVDLLDAAADDAILVCRYDHGVSRIGPLARAQRAVVKDGLFSLAELVRSEPLRIEGDPLPTVDV